MFQNTYWAEFPNYFEEIVHAPCMLLSQHNAQMLLACNYSHIMLSTIDSSLSGGQIIVKYILVLFACYMVDSSTYLYPGPNM